LNNILEDIPSIGFFPRIQLMRNRFLSAIATGLVLVSSSSCIADGTPDLAARAKQELSARDPAELLRGSIFFFYRNFGNPQLTPLARAVWNLDREKYPDLSWDLLDEPEFRINFAQLWARWTTEVNKNRSELQSIRSYVDPFLSSGRVERRGPAVDFLGAVGDESDIPLLKQIALEDQSTVTLNAVLAIRSIGGAAANSALQDLYEKVRDPLLKERIKSIMQRK
jgi:hypothetical protein